MAVLCLLSEEGAMSQRRDIGDQPVTIGRDASADWMIPDDALSRRHFTILREGEHFVLEDLGSQNGTSVDGQRTHRTRLKQNDCILAGRTLFLFHEHALPAAVGLSGTMPIHKTAFLPAGSAAQRAAQRESA
jgi:pSer/pThr/pTyr-binding forkhead associated (FHA) protein